MAFRTGRRRRHLAITVGVLSVSATMLAGCGAPEYTYITNSEDHTYLKVPNSWQPVDQGALGAAIGLDPSADASGNGFWLAGYDAATIPSPSHLLGPQSDAPAMFVGVRDIPAASRGQVSLDLLRDVFWPVSMSRRQQEAADPASPFSGFGLISDEVLTPGNGLRGVHVVYSYRIQGGPAQVFDQTVYTNDDASKLFMFYVRCSSECFEQRQQEIGTVVSSFTVRETPS